MPQSALTNLCLIILAICFGPKLLKYGFIWAFGVASRFIGGALMWGVGFLGGGTDFITYNPSQCEGLISGYYEKAPELIGLVERLSYNKCLGLQTGSLLQNEIHVFIYTLLAILVILYYVGLPVKQDLPMDSAIRAALKAAGFDSASRQYKQQLEELKNKITKLEQEIKYRDTYYLKDSNGFPTTNQTVQKKRAELEKEIQRLQKSADQVKKLEEKASGLEATDLVKEINKLKQDHLLKVNQMVKDHSDEKFELQCRLEKVEEGEQKRLEKTAKRHSKEIEQVKIDIGQELIKAQELNNQAMQEGRMILKELEAQRKRAESAEKAFAHEKQPKGDLQGLKQQKEDAETSLAAERQGRSILQNNFNEVQLSLAILQSQLAETEVARRIEVEMLEQNLGYRNVEIENLKQQLDYSKVEIENVKQLVSNGYESNAELATLRQELQKSKAEVRDMKISFRNRSAELDETFFKNQEVVVGIRQEKDAAEDRLRVVDAERIDLLSRLQAKENAELAMNNRQAAWQKQMGAMERDVMEARSEVRELTEKLQVCESREYAAGVPVMGATQAAVAEYSSVRDEQFSRQPQQQDPLSFLNPGPSRLDQARQRKAQHATGRHVEDRNHQPLGEQRHGGGSLGVQHQGSGQRRVNGTIGFTMVAPAVGVRQQDTAVGVLQQQGIEQLKVDQSITDMMSHEYNE